MGLSGKGSQLRGGLRRAGRLAEQSLAEHQRLICAHDKLIWMAQRNRNGLLACQQRCNLAWRGQTGSALNRAFIDLSWDCPEWNAGIGYK
jgi:hypothetical protein